MVTRVIVTHRTAGKPLRLRATLTFTQPAVVHAYVFANVFVLPVPNGPAVRLILFFPHIMQDFNELQQAKAV